MTRVPKTSWRPGLAPGTLLELPGAHPTRVRVLSYDEESVREVLPSDLDSLREPSESTVSWIDLVGLADLDLVSGLGQELGIHPLILEDVLNAKQRPKVELYETHDLFVVARMPVTHAEPFATEQLSLLCRPGMVVTFQERPGDCFDAVRERIRVPGSRLRRLGSDYLAYALLDAVVDSFHPPLERYREILERLEERVIGETSTDFLQELYALRGNLIRYRRSALPLRDAISQLTREDEKSPFTAETRLFLRDTQDHTVRAVDRVETYREQASSLLELHLTLASHRSNDVMKVLTMIATVFIPLSFLVGLYGMNFDTSSRWNMPELDARFGYPILLGFMFVVVALQLWYFRRKGWF